MKTNLVKIGTLASFLIFPSLSQASQLKCYLEGTRAPLVIVEENIPKAGTATMTWFDGSTDIADYISKDEATNVGGLTIHRTTKDFIHINFNLNIEYECTYAPRRSECYTGPGAPKPYTGSYNDTRKGSVPVYCYAFKKSLKELL